MTLDLWPWIAADPDALRLIPLIAALQSIVAGNRDRPLADASELHHTMAAEILFLIETLEMPPVETDAFDPPTVPD